MIGEPVNRHDEKGPKEADMHTAIALFHDSSSLQRALDELYSSGIDSERVRVFGGAEAAGGADADGAATGRTPADDSMVQTGVAGRAAYPGDTRVATAGGIGPFAAPGSTAGTPAPGIVTGSLYDSLRDFEVDEDEARYFGDSLGEDTQLLVVKVADDDASRVYDIFRRAGANRSNEPGR